MEQWLFVLLCLVGILFVAQVAYSETFVDASDNSGSMITVSLTDLLSLIGKSNTPAAPAATAPTPIPQPIVLQTPGTQSQLDSQFYSNLKNSIVKDVTASLSSTLATQSAPALLTDDCIDSAVNQQSADFLRYIPGKNPADYIRKDSVPCYGCSIPT
jgi:hypothetical protein